jgi:hypothetical protein
MPLARIFTRNPEGTADLSGQLRQQGYIVELARPDQTNLAPVDLEIEFEVCERADVLDRAAGLADELGADVAVAPGILQPAIQHAAATSTQPMAEPVGENLVELMSLPGSEHESERDAAKRDREQDFEAAFAPVIGMPAARQDSPAVVDIPVMEHEPMPPVAFLEDAAAPAPAAMAEMTGRYPEAPVSFSSPARGADPMPYLAQLTPFSTPAARAEEQPLPAVNRVQEPSQIQLRGKKVLQDGAKVAAHAWVSALALASSTTASLRDHFEEYKKRAQVRSAEARAQHAARLLDLEQRRAEAQQRASELEVAREAAAARLLELVRQRDPGLSKESLARESLPKETLQPERPPQELWSDATAVERRAPVQRQPSQSMYERLPNERRREAPPIAAQTQEPVRKPLRAAAMASPIEIWRSINPPLRAVLSGAAAVTALFIMGIALGVFHSRPPLANTTDHASNGVTVKTGGVTVQAGTARPQTASPGAGAQTQAKPQPGQPAQAQSAGTVTKPSPSMRQTHLVAEQSEKQIGDDVVIRHYSRPVPTQKPKQAGQQAGLKHFSDLDN